MNRSQSQMNSTKPKLFAVAAVALALGSVLFASPAFADTDPGSAAAKADASAGPGNVAFASSPKTKLTAQDADGGVDGARIGQSGFQTYVHHTTAPSTVPTGTSNSTAYSA